MELRSKLHNCTFKTKETKLSTLSEKSGEEMSGSFSKKAEANKSIKIICTTYQENAKLNNNEMPPCTNKTH